MGYRLDEDAKSKLREIVEKRAKDKAEVLAQVTRHLDSSTNPSPMLCKIARTLIDGEFLAEPPDRPKRQPPQNAHNNHNSYSTCNHAQADDHRPKKERDRSRDRDKKRDRSKSRERSRDRSKSRKRSRSKSRKRKRDRSKSRKRSRSSDS